MEITGRVKTVLPLQEGTSQRGPWAKAIVVIEYKSGDYTNTLALENMGKAREFVALPVGGEFTFWFDPVSREYNGRYYTQCNCYNWQPTAQSQYPQQPAAPAYPAPPQGYTPAPQQNYPPQPAPGYPQPPQGYAPQAQPQGGYPADGDMPY